MPRIDREIENGGFQLIGVYATRPEIRSHIEANVDFDTDRAANEHLDLRKEIVDANGFGRKALDARKGEELLRQLGAALDRYQNLIESPGNVFVAHAPTNEVEVSADDHQEVVEVVSEAAG
jgi:hypothetical protein